jgi:hypothetical protein
MAQVKKLLLHVAVELAERKRRCHRNRRKHVITKGTACLAVFEGPRGTRRNYCLECAGAMLTLAQADLTGLVTALEEGVAFPVEAT